jgi:hypothetical protein
VAAIVKKLMAKDPEERYQTPAELARELEPWATERPKVVSANQTACRPLWIAPPTQVPADPRAASEPAGSTRFLDAELLIAPAQKEIEPSGPSLFEPSWKYAPGEAHRKETHDTLSLSRPEDTEVVTAEAKADAAVAPSRARVDSDSTLQELGSSSAAVSSTGGASGAALVAPERLDPSLRRLWRRWRALLQTIIKGSGPARVNSETYRAVHTNLLLACRAAAEAAVTLERRAFYQELVSIVQPWLTLQTFARTESEMLRSLLERCRQAELELNEGKVPWTIRQFVGLVLLAMSPIGLAVWYWNSGRLWLPSLLRAFQWDSSKPSASSAWDYVSTHPSVLMGVIFPLVIVVSIYLLVRTPRS